MKRAFLFLHIALFLQPFSPPRGKKTKNFDNKNQRNMYAIVNIAGKQFKEQKISLCSLQKLGCRTGANRGMFDPGLVS